MDMTYPPALPSLAAGESPAIGALMDAVERLGLRFALVDDQVRLIGDRALLGAEYRVELARRRGEIEALVCMSLTRWEPPAKAAKAERPVFGQVA